MRKFYNIPENQLIGEGIDSNLYNTYFYVEDISGEDGNECIITKSDIDAPDVYLEYSYDQINWITLPVTSVDGYSITIPANSKLYLRGENERWGLYIRPEHKWNMIYTTDNCNIGGNIMSLLYSSKFIGQQSISHPYCFQRLFNHNNTLINANNLILPAITLPNSVYLAMFFRCINLVNSPKVLPSEYLPAEAYAYMFEGCSNLITSPEIKIKRTHNNELLYTGLMYMFCQCYKINFIKCHLMEYDENILTNWLQNVSPTGTFLLPVGSSFADNAPRNGSGIPEGWEIKYFNPETDEIIN